LWLWRKKKEDVKMYNLGQELASIDFESMIGGPLVAVVNAQAQAAMSTVNFIKTVGFKQVAGEQDFVSQEVGDPVYVTFKYQKVSSPYDPGAPGQVTSILVTDGSSGYDPSSLPEVTIGDPTQPIPTEGGIKATAEATVENGIVTRITITDPGKGYATVPKVTIQAPDAPATGTAPPAATAIALIDPQRDEADAEYDDVKLEVPLLTMVPIPYLRVESTTIDFNAKINSIEYKKTDETLKIGGRASAGVSLPIPVQIPFMASAKLRVSSSYKKNTQTGINVERTYSMAIHVRAVQDEMPAGMERVLGILEDAIKSKPV
jgi:hypothetical protein